MTTNTNNTIQELINLANNYDRFTAYIDNYRQQREAEQANERITKEFIEAARLLGINATSSDFYMITSSTGATYSKLTVEEAVYKFLQEKGYKEEETMKTERNNMCETCVNYNPNEDSLTCQACGEDGISYWEPKEDSIKPVTVPEKATLFHSPMIPKEETTMKKDLATITLNMNRNERLVYVWETVLNVTNTSDKLYIDKEKLAKFLFDNDIIQRQLSKKELKKTGRQELIDILDTAVQNLAKAGLITINKEEEREDNAMIKTTVDIINNPNTPDEVIYEKLREEVAMIRTTLDIINNPNTPDEVICEKFREETGITVRELVKYLFDYLREKQAEEIDKAKVSVCEQSEKQAVTVAEPFVPVEYSKEIAGDILKKVIITANKNDSHNVISDWMLTSAVAEVVIGHPLKGKDENGKWTEFHLNFTEEQKENIKSIRVQFLRNNGFKPIKDKDGKTTSYIIPAKLLVYGRHKWLGLDCIYHFIDKNNNVTVYHVSLSGIKNAKTGTITPLSDDAYNKLDTVCRFIA